MIQEKILICLVDVRWIVYKITFEKSKEHLRSAVSECMVPINLSEDTQLPIKKELQ
jgi:hypothetical protein